MQIVARMSIVQNKSKLSTVSKSSKSINSVKIATSIGENVELHFSRVDWVWEIVTNRRAAAAASESWALYLTSCSEYFFSRQICVFLPHCIYIFCKYFFSPPPPNFNSKHFFDFFPFPNICHVSNLFPSCTPLLPHNSPEALSPPPLIRKAVDPCLGEKPIQKTSEKPPQWVS